MENVLRLRRRTQSSRDQPLENDVMAHPAYHAQQLDRTEMRAMFTDPDYQNDKHDQKSSENGITPSRHGRSSLIIDAQSQ
jgi:hypothetical protein